jgi:hypothetical protein
VAEAIAGNPQRSDRAIADEIALMRASAPRHCGVREVGNAMPLEAVLFTEERQ